MPKCSSLRPVSTTIGSVASSLVTRSTAEMPFASGRLRSSRTQSGRLTRQLFFGNGDRRRPLDRDVGAGVVDQLLDQDGVALIVLDQQQRNRSFVGAGKAGGVQPLWVIGCAHGPSDPCVQIGRALTLVFIRQHIDPTGWTDDAQPVQVAGPHQRRAEPVSGCPSAPCNRQITVLG